MPENESTSQSGYATAQEAATAALKESLPLSSQFEFAGAIYEQDGRFFFTKPATAGESHSIKVKVRYPKGAKLAALYHTHPEGRDSELFSPSDIQVASQLDIPYYMGHYADGAMRVFNPGVSEVDKRRGSREQMFRRMKFSEGMLVGNAFEKLVPTQSSNDILVSGERLNNDKY